MGPDRFCLAKNFPTKVFEGAFDGMLQREFILTTGGGRRNAVLLGACEAECGVEVCGEPPVREA
ncbi:MAG: hypothetical protein ACLUDU_18540 [Butyricimonas faecihominis]